MEQSLVIEKDIYTYWLGSIPGIKANKIRAILDYFKSPREAFYASDKTMEDMVRVSHEKGIGFTDKDMEHISVSRDYSLLERGYDYLKEHMIGFTTLLDASYPEKLRHIYDAPFMLYYKGKVLPEDKKILAVVGARECSLYGRDSAKYLAGALAKEGIIIISGLARGIDSYAHMGALSQEGSTYGVMGCGIDICYPAENINLYMEMQLRGGIISEYGPGIKPLAHHFPMRNRIISALSDGILVVEAREKSGSLITVDMGLEQGKNIYALPGRITDKLSEGCNNLIKMGAKPVTSPMDILEDLIPYTPSREDGQLAIGDLLPHDEQLIYNLLDLSPKHVEELMELTALDIGRLMELLLSLELKDMVGQPMKNYYMRKRT